MVARWLPIYILATCNLILAVPSYNIVWQHHNCYIMTISIALYIAAMVMAIQIQALSQEFFDGPHTLLTNQLAVYIPRWVTSFVCIPPHALVYVTWPCVSCLSVDKLSMHAAEQNCKMIVNCKVTCYNC